MIDPEKLESFARASRRSGVMSGVGALVVFAALGYGIWETMRLNQRIEERKSELQELKAKAEDARTEIAILDGQKKLLLDQIKAIETAVQNVEPDGHVSRILGSVSKREPTPVPAQDRAKSATTLTPIFAVVKPRAEAHPSGSRNTSGQIGVRLFAVDRCTRRPCIRDSLRLV